jgi:transcriptional/translational regulatory protein YebC/TACO1
MKKYRRKKLKRICNNKLTPHARKQAHKRNISHRSIQNAILYGTKTKYSNIDTPIYRYEIEGIVAIVDAYHRTIITVFRNE